jgi:hypothetical protein
MQYGCYCVFLAAHRRLPADALADLCVARQLYSASHARIKQQRQALLQQLQAVMEQYSSMGQYGSDDALSNALGEGPSKKPGAALCCCMFWCCCAKEALSFYRLHGAMNTRLCVVAPCC